LGSDLRGMNWRPLNSLEELSAIDALSREVPVLLFKHSTTCSISRAALNRLEREWKPADDERTTYYLDLHRFRPVSDAVAQRYGIQHESPQALVIRDGECRHHASHFSITYAGTIEAMSS